MTEVTKRFLDDALETAAVIRQVSLMVKTGEVLVIQGPSGSGKTTLLKLISGMIRPTSGRIEISGRQLTGLSLKYAARLRRRTIGFVFQDLQLLHGFSAIENVMIPGYPEGISKQQLRKRALTLLERLGIEAKAKTRVQNLSGGEQQRLAVARAMINDPPILLADEPTAHLDSIAAVGFMDMIAALKIMGKTIIIGTHDPVVFDSAVIDRGLIIRDGKLYGRENPLP